MNKWTAVMPFLVYTLAVIYTFLATKHKPLPEFIEVEQTN